MKLVGEELNSAIIEVKKAAESMPNEAEKMQLEEALKQTEPLCTESA
jgi:hypothetical protein